MRAILCLLSLSAVLLGQAAAAKPDPFAELRFLVGTWQLADSTGAPGKAGAGEFSFRAELDGRTLVRRNVADYPAQEGRPAFRHEDNLTVYADGGALRALYLDNEGHAIHYLVSALPGERGIRFLSEGPGPRFRMEYRPAAAGTVDFSFDLAAPGKDFSNYIKASVRRKQ